MLRVFHDSIPMLRSIPSIPFEAVRVVPSDYAMLFAASAATWVLSLKRAGLSTFASFPRVLLAQLRALGLALLTTGAVVFLLKMSGISRLFFAYYFALGLVLLVAKHGVAHAIARNLRRSGFGQRHALVIGSGRAAAWFAGILEDASEHGYRLVGVLLTKKVISVESFGVPVIGVVEDLARTLVEHPVEEVFIVGGAEEIACLAPVADDLIRKGRVVSLVSTLATNSEGVRGRITEFSGVPMISFGPMPHNELGATMKRAIDVGVAVIALVLLAPVMMAAALSIKVLDPGPVLFRQERLGVGGVRFHLLKFRSMKVDAEQILRADKLLYRRYVENDYKLPEGEDPRISRWGRFLRKTSIDELPQLWNVLVGEMSLVGPRPIVPAEIDRYEPYTHLFLSVRPGVTGHWQVNGRSHVRYPERAFMDLDYIGSNSVLSDLSIIAKTVPAVLTRRGAT